ncbi:MAG: calcium/sodium antiporter [Thermodesulfobacteriota bacterium]|nr:calcium/sodium antiporter [Thermodesulfobacteriota bacterium]
MTSMLLALAMVAVSTGLLWKGSEWVVDSAVRIARKLQMSDLAIGLTVVAIGTSAPEFAVTVNAAIRGLADISVSNVVGSNIFNLGFILGGCAAIRTIRTSPAIVWRDGLFLLTMSSVLVFFLRDLTLAPKEGLALFLALVLYITCLFWIKTRVTETDDRQQATWKDIPVLVAGIAAVVGGGHLLVWSATSLARGLGLSEWVIGVTIVAAGTSAPEFATSLMAAVKRRYAMSIGNLIGSDLYNLLGVLGLAGMLGPLHIDAIGLQSLYLLVAMVALVVIFMRTGFQVSRAEGFILIAINLLRWVVDFSGQG